MSPLFSRLFGKPRPAKAPPSTDGRLAYAVGDVHGRLDVLQPLAAEIAADMAATAAAERPVLVFLGDYVDRGPASAGVIDLILELSAEPDFEVRALKGNHEEAMLTFLDDPAFGATWMGHGGAATLASYGVQPPASRTDPDVWADTRDAFAKALPATHLHFLLGLELTTVVGDYAFVHAGVRPGVPLDRQSERDLLWIRYEFLEAPGPFGKVIVHGHTPMEEPQVTPYRLGIDTGAYATGVLTAVRLQGDHQRIIQARARKPAAATA
jgi:serine/threonine protein phosphatase 1